MEIWCCMLYVFCHFIRFSFRWRKIGCAKKQKIFEKRKKKKMKKKHKQIMKGIQFKQTLSFCFLNDLRDDDERNKKKKFTEYKSRATWRIIFFSFFAFLLFNHHPREKRPSNKLSPENSYCREWQLCQFLLLSLHLCSSNMYTTFFYFLLVGKHFLCFWIRWNKQKPKQIYKRQTILIFERNFFCCCLCRIYD